MSTLDRAFIRAYQKQRVIPAPHVAFPAAKAAEAIDSAPVESLAVEPLAIDTLPVKPLPGEPSPLEPETAQLPAAPSAEAAAPRATIEPPELEQPVFEPAAAETAPETALVRAALEVEQFDWPETVETLRQSSIDYFNAWSEQFSAQRSVTIVAASEARGAGRTTVLLAAARHLSLVRPEARIALVDADFRNPELAVRLGVALEIGWEDVFAGEDPLAEALVESNADRVTLLPLAAAVDDERLVAGADRVRESLSRLQQSFDFVCIDAGPLDSAADLAAFGQELKIDAALIVRDMRRGGDEDNSTIGRRLAQLGVRHWDLVENFVQAPREAELLGH
jgi:Mrp family chromosome partitioning ATPase